ncbi:MAG: hypothetical protein WCP21_17590, partial [Armatimonadota bacterium]
MMRSTASRAVTCLTLVALAATVLADGAAVQVTISSAARSVGMGRPVTVTAVTRTADGKPASGYRLLPTVNGLRWGSHETADALGRATFLLPLPRPGTAR